jgi:hypothetical protein
MLVTQRQPNGFSVQTQIAHAKRDLAGDMFDEINRNQYQSVLIGKKSFKEVS